MSKMSLALPSDFQGIGEAGTACFYENTADMESAKLRLVCGGTYFTFAGVRFVGSWLLADSARVHQTSIWRLLQGQSLNQLLGRWGLAVLYHKQPQPLHAPNPSLLKIVMCTRTRYDDMPPHEIVSAHTKARNLIDADSVSTSSSTTAFTE